MKCPGDDKHEGIKVVRCGKDSPHYAKAVCSECDVRIKWLGKQESEALTGFERSDKTLMEELHEVAEEASEDVRGADAERTYRVDDVVWYYLKAGEIHKGEIMHWNSDNTYDLYDGDRNWKAADLYPTKEEAEKALSPAGRRMAGCLREATEIYAEEIGNLLADDRREVTLKIAFRLFNTTKERV